jgi:hypothetical protein
MALIIADRVKETTNTTGTGDLTLDGAGTGYQSFSAVGDGNTTYYAVSSVLGTEWEVGIGTYTASGTTLSRDTILDSSNSGSAVNFSAGTKDVYVVAPADKSVVLDASSVANIATLNVSNYIDLTNTSDPSHSEGRVFYDTEYKCLAVFNDESDITLQVGQEEWIRVYNNTGSTIDNGTPVYATGASGETPTIAPADATTYAKARVLGVATHSIENASYGYVTTRGLVSGIDTSSLTAGQPIHLAADGSLQTAAPTYPYFPTDLGGCVVSDASDGYIYVNIREHSFEQFRVTGNTHMGGNLTVAGDLSVTGTQSITSQNNLAVSNSFVYMNSGDTIGSANTTFTGSGLNDGILTGHYEGTTTIHYYVRIDSVGGGTGGVDTFEWSKDNFSTTEATDVDIDTDGVALDNNISITFNAATGHTLNDVWDGEASPVNTDTGFFTNRNTGTSGVGYTHAGVYFDVSDQKWKVVAEYDPEPEGTIDTGDASFNLGTLAASAFEGDLTGDVTGDVTGNLTGNVTGNVTGAVTGNASTATALQTARTIGGVSFDGTANINLPGVNTAGNQNTSGNAATATKLATARTIGGVSFDGTANINLPGVDSIGNQDTTGNAGTATALETARTIGGVSFDGTANINLPGVNTTGNQNTTGSAATLTTARSIGLGGDVSGSASFDGSANITITATVADDSHNHVISNVDGLQTALDAKQAASTALTTSTSFGGDVSGTYNAIVVANDSHTHDGRYFTETESDARYLLESNNLSDLTSASTARSNLGLGSLATLSSVNASTITDNSVGAAELNVSGNGTSGQALTSDGDGTFSWATAAAGAVDDLFWKNGTAINSSYNINDGRVWGTFGPVTIATGVTMTVTSGFWTVA